MAPAGTRAARVAATKAPTALTRRIFFNMIEVKRSPVHGRGVFASASIPRRTVIGTYEGVRYQPEEVPEAVVGAPTYLFALSDGTTIDGSRRGNFTRLINHCCRPNCQALETTDLDEVLQIEIRAKQSIKAGDELTIDYALIVADEDRHQYPCRCGAQACRKTMAG